MGNLNRKTEEDVLLLVVLYDGWNGLFACQEVRGFGDVQQTSSSKAISSPLAS